MCVFHVVVTVDLVYCFALGKTLMQLIKEGWEQIPETMMASVAGMIGLILLFSDFSVFWLYLAFTWLSNALTCRFLFYNM